MSREKDKKSYEINRRDFLKIAGAGGLALSSASLFGLGSVNRAMAASEPLHVGSVIPLTGPYAVIAGAQRMGVLMAQDEINAKGGILGRPVEVHIRDSELKPALALRRLREIVERDKIIWHVGTLHAGIALAINDYCKRIKMPYFSACNTPDSMFKKGVIGKYTFPLLNVCGNIGYSGGTYVFNHLGKKAYMIVVDYAWGHYIRDGILRAAKEYGGEVVGMDHYPLGVTDLTAYLTKARAAKPEVFIGVCPGLIELMASKQIHEMGLKNDMKVYQCWQSQFTSEGDPAAHVGNYGGIDLYYKYDWPTTKDFTKRFVDKYGTVPDSYSTGTYTALMILAKIANEKKTLDPDVIVREVENGVFDYTKGPIRWRKEDHMIIHRWFITKGKMPPEDDSHDIMDVEWIAEGEKFAPTLESLGY
jgi:branched-chain amino acid transport system substrate-binding protein